MDRRRLLAAIAPLIGAGCGVAFACAGAFVAVPSGESFRVVVVKETRIIEREGNKVEVAVVQDSDGKTEQIEITREDTADNAGDLEGSIIADSDKATPGVDSEMEVEVDE